MTKRWTGQNTDLFQVCTMTARTTKPQDRSAGIIVRRFGNRTHSHFCWPSGEKLLSPLPYQVKHQGRMHHKVVGNFRSEADVRSLYYRRWSVLPKFATQRSIGEVNSNRVTSSLLRKWTRLPTHACEVGALTFEVTDNFGSNGALPCGAYRPRRRSSSSSSSPPSPLPLLLLLLLRLPLLLPFFSCFFVL